MNKIYNILSHVYNFGLKIGSKVYFYGEVHGMVNDFIYKRQMTNAIHTGPKNL